MPELPKQDYPKPEPASKEPPRRAAPDPRPAPAAPRAATPGRGGQQHKYLQSLLKRFAEDKGWRAEIEKQVPGGSVDVSLARDGREIACEISITTGTGQEIGNIRKCLAANYERIILISPQRKTLRDVQEAAARLLSPDEKERIQFFTPEEFFAFLEAEEAGATNREDTIRGYKVKTSFRAVDGKESENRKSGIAQTILQALKRLKGG